MATRLPTFLTSETDPFSEAEQMIHLKFNKLSEALRRRREQLLTELRVLREQHKVANAEIVNEIKDLEASKTELTQHCREMRGNVAKLGLEKLIHKLEEQISDLSKKMSSSSVGVELSCDTDNLEQAITDLGKICVKSSKRDERVVERDYSLIKSPLFKVSKFGSNEKVMNYPNGLCIDNKTNLVYIADTGNKRIHAWTLNGEYVSTFGEGVLKYPENLTLLNGALFVSDSYHHSIFKFNISNFSLLTRSDYNLNYPFGICSDTNEVFVISGNNNIVVFDTNLSFLKEFKGRIKECSDMKIKNSILYLLEVEENQIKLLNSNTSDLISTIITNGDGVNFGNACYFCLDQSGNFLITNWATNQIKIITGDGTLLRLIDTNHWKLKEPRGIEVSNSNKIALVTNGMFCLI